MAEFITLRTALLLYWLNILAFGALLLASWRYAKHAGLVEPDVSSMINLSVERRVFVAQALYAVGAALCLFSTYWSIGSSCWSSSIMWLDRGSVCWREFNLKLSKIEDIHQVYPNSVLLL